MAITFDEMIRSRPFEFIVGPDRKSFTAHAVVVADHSAPLSRLINGSMSEAKERVVILDDVEEETFVRFCEYAYMGDYTPAQNEIGLLASKNRAASVPYAEDDDLSTSRSKTKKKGKGKSSIGFNNFNDLATESQRVTTFGSAFGSATYEPQRVNPFGSNEIVDEIAVVEPQCRHCGHGTKQTLWDDFQGREYSVISPKFWPRKKLEESKANNFLHHARVYVFADRYDITKLQDLALDKLHQMLLLSFDNAGNQTESIVDLVRFSYSNVNTRDTEVGQDIDSLRRIVIHFVACVFEKVGMNESFLVLMEEGGPLARDLASMLARRITL